MVSVPLCWFLEEERGQMCKPALPQRASRGNKGSGITEMVEVLARVLQEHEGPFPMPRAGQFGTLITPSEGTQPII